MTDELDTNRLRALSEYSTTGLLSQAADEIDRLRAELAKCLRCHVPDRGAGESLQAIRDGLHRTYDTATHAAVPHEELAQLRADARRYRWLQREWREMRAELGEVVKAIGTSRYMDPPDGGLPTTRMYICNPATLDDAIDAAQQEEGDAK